MAGLTDLQARRQPRLRKLFEISWREQAGTEDNVAATGFSSRRELWRL